MCQRVQFPKGIFKHMQTLSFLRELEFFACALSPQDLHVTVTHALFSWGINIWLHACIVSLSSVSMGNLPRFGLAYAHMLWQVMLEFLLLYLGSEERNHVQQSKFNCLVEVWLFSLEQKKKIKLRKPVLEALEIAVPLAVQSISAALLFENPQWLHTQASANILD